MHRMAYIQKLTLISIRMDGSILIDPAAQEKKYVHTYIYIIYFIYIECVIWLIHKPICYCICIYKRHRPTVHIPFDTNHTPEMDSEVDVEASVDSWDGKVSFFLFFLLPWAFNSILDACGATGWSRQHTGASNPTQPNLALRISQNCNQFVSVAASSSSSQQPRVAQPVCPRLYIQSRLVFHREVCVYGLQVVSTATYERVTDRITRRRERERESACIMHEHRSGDAP